MIKELTASGSDQAFDEGVRQRYVRYGLDLFDVENAEVRLPAVILEKRAWSELR